MLSLSLGSQKEASVAGVISLPLTFFWAAPFRGIAWTQPASPLKMCAELADVAIVSRLEG